MSSNTDTLEKRSPTPTKPKPQPPYAVIVLNDEQHTFEYVIEVLQKVCAHKLEEAFTLTKRVHDTGQAVVWSGTMEVAELKRDQIRGFGPDFYADITVRFPLGVRIEPMPGSE
jgi:ATP-dependent Clp protease adaptor protein ClpS